MNSPFLHFPSLELEAQKESPRVSEDFLLESPFLAAPQLNGGKVSVDPKSGQFVQIMDELYDEEFEEAIENLLNEADDLRQSRVEGDNYFTNEYQAQNLVHEYYAPLNRKVDDFFNNLIQQGEQIDNRAKNMDGLESFLESYTYEDNRITDIQENFFGGLRKIVGGAVGAIKKGVSYAGKLAAKFGLGFLFKKLKKIAVKFLRGFLNKGISKLPTQFQGIARNLAEKILPKSVQVPASSTPAGNTDNTQAAQEPAEELQQELNSSIAFLLSADNEIEWELVEREIDSVENASPEMTIDLSGARKNFVNQLSQLDEGGNAEPQVEQFVQVILTALKFVIPIVGRQRVINWLSSLISKLIEKFIGKESAKALSRQMVEKGFSMLNLETSPEEAVEVGTGAIAATIEETVRQLEHFPSYAFEDRPLFERYAIEAFEQAAAANMPDILNESIYSKYPWLRESNRRRVYWGWNRLRDHRHRQHPRVKKLNEVIEAELTPFIAEEVRTFGGISLATFLRDRMGVTVNSTIPVRMHLFEALPNSRLHHLAKFAEGIPGMESSGQAAWKQFHPLTSIAAGLLLGEPGLGCRSAKKCLNKHRDAGGHRYYYIEVPGARPQFFAAQNKGMVLRAVSGVSAKLDFLANEIRLKLYLSEADAQAIATSLRKNQAETAHVLASMTLESGLKNVFSYGQYGDLKIVHPNIIPGKRSGLAMDAIPPVLVNALMGGIKNWAGKALINYLRDKPDQFVQAAEDYADGVTLDIVMISPPDFTFLRQMLSGATISLTEALFTKEPADVVLNARPGNK